ncbi:hypothetical protein HCN51_25715 [Nonomuraea sp. FMUSA5-5]|uniref:Uncharacterized protein n=1 Tax=Nonomuraea composti TaxID=2720023 RepID=A0ABX1B4Q7_9ACTN|nr:hypothetical protein [Nonomuraea sp. FMUSA5-5]NJP92814.1 hypothetical protein [Nonomuraea sp. FMUSA5-5]
MRRRLEFEKNAPKFSYYKGNERVIFDDRRVIELVKLDVKWPFLNDWRRSLSRAAPGR